MVRRYALVDGRPTSCSAGTWSGRLVYMKRIGAYEAKTHLPRILKQVLAGETFVVTRNGEPIAEIGPIKEERMKPDPKAVLAEIRALKIKLGTPEEIRGLRDSGRRA